MKTVPRTVDTRTFVALAAVYFGSGFVALVDEVVFSKYLSLVFGATAQASSAVLVAYMGGLALGAVLAARFERNVARPAWLYGVLEVVVGVVCLVVPSLFGGLTKIYVALASGASSLVVLEVLRGGVAAAVVLLPTTAIRRQGRTTFVYKKKDDGTMEQVTITTSGSDSTNTGIATGLVEGDKVVVGAVPGSPTARASTSPTRAPTTAGGVR